MKFAPLAMLAALAACSGTEAGNSSTSAAPVAAVKAPAGTDWTQTVTRTEEGFRMGNPAAAVKLVEYGSRLCPACRAFAAEAYRPIVDGYVSTGKVSFEFREFLIHGAPDLPPALLGRCVGEAAFFPVMEQQFADQTQFTDKLTPQFMQQFQGLAPAQAIPRMAESMGLIAWMQQRGLPEAKARQCLTDGRALDALAKQTQDRGADGTVSATPTLIVNGAKVDGANPNMVGWADVEKALKAAGA